MKPITRRKGSVSVKIYHTPVVAKGKTYDAFTVRYYHRDKTCQKKFGKFEDADAHANLILGQINDGTLTAETISIAEMVDFSEAKKLLNGRVSCTEAARYYVERHPTSIIPQTVAEVFKEMMIFKKQDNLSDRWIETLDFRAGKFSKKFGSQNIGELTGPKIDEWLRAVAAGARNRNNFRCAVSTLISFAKRRKYLPRDWYELESSPKTKETPGAIKIFTPDEMLKMLNTAPSLNVKTLLLFGGFAGLRTSEIGRLDWLKVGKEFIEVMGRKGRTASRRLSPVLPSFKALAKAIREPQGRVNTILDMNHVPKQIERASGVQWKHNALRHSFISYRVAAIKNTAQVALECGTSEQKIFQNYRELVTERSAREYFSIYKLVTNF